MHIGIVKRDFVGFVDDRLRLDRVVVETFAFALLDRKSVV
jgi:hypothetical protein